MTTAVLLSKYDARRRSGEVEDWTSHDDIGASFNGSVLTPEEYQRVEDLYIAAVETLARAAGARLFVLRHVVLNRPEPWWLGRAYEGRVVDLPTALRLLRDGVRDGTNVAWLESGEFEVGVVTDFYLAARIPDSALGALAEIESTGLYAVRVPSWLEEDESPVVARRADDGFWSEVAARSGLEGESTLVLERWANGSYGYRWHLVCDGDFSSVAGAASAQSLITAFQGPTIRWAARDDLLPSVRSLWGDDDPRVVVFPRLDAVALQARTYGEGVPLPGEDELPPGEAFGYFLWPEDGVAFTRAVVPGEDGSIVAGWPES